MCVCVHVILRAVKMFLRVSIDSRVKGLETAVFTLIITHRPRCSRSSAHNEFVLILYCPRSALGAITMACSSSSFLVLTAINATLENPSFRTGSKAVADALKSAQTLKNWYESETNIIFLASFSA